MTHRRSRTLAVLAFAALGAASGLFAVGEAQARPLTPAERHYIPYTGRMPACSDERVLARIAKRFRQREETYWHSGLRIAGFRHVRQTGYRSAGVDLIPKRYCTATALFESGRKRRVTYWIGEELGMAGAVWGLGSAFGLGASWGVEWCVHGLDRHMAFAPACRAAGP